MQKNFITLMLLVAAVTSATLDPTNVDAFADWMQLESPSNYRIDSRMRRQVPSTDAKEEASASSDVPIIDGSTLLKELASVQSPTTGIRQASSAISLPIDTSAISISLNSCIFIGLKLSIVINILDPVACSKICASNSDCTHFTHEPLQNGGTCTLHKAPGLGNEWSSPAPRSSGATCGYVPKDKCVSSDGSLLNLCLYLALKIRLGLL
ncbi:hypothetical protein OUZ56_023778 [Daphnia magna]|nr:hypothetical protein OUZ56_023778 [Daphnia magna]